MALVDLWNSNPRAIEQFTIEQVVKVAGDGNLRDGSLCSQELRQFLGVISSSKIVTYVEQCLLSTFADSGMVLQDLVNELGRRLGYIVTNGLYRGVVNKIGFDGAWKSPEEHTIVVEVKKTAAYQITLASISGYRDKLKATNSITPSSSILIVVGQEGTGDLESQVRGSPYAWDIRLISAEALGKLVQIKENAEGGEVVKKIRELLVPWEYTRLDRMIDFMFTTAKDTAEAVKETVAPGEGDEPTSQQSAASPTKPDKVWQFTDDETLQTLREQILNALDRVRNIKFVKRGGVLYWDSTHDKRLACTLSKKYEQKSPAGYGYWYGYHKTWDEFLEGGSISLVALGCVEASFAFVVPWANLHSILASLDSRTVGTRKYWYLRLAETTPSHHALLLAAGSVTFPLDEYRISLG